MRIALIGAGRLAANLGHSVLAAGHEVTEVFSQTADHAQVLADALGCRWTTQLEAIRQDADLCIVSVSDVALSSVISRMPTSPRALYVHTAGSMEMDLWKGRAARYGVFYPMQTFSKERQVDFSRIPCFLEASDPDALSELKTFASSLTNVTYVLTSEQRKYLHLAAVFACNFVNHCYALSDEILSSCSIPFETLLPLIEETAAKVRTLSPREAQTGPAVREDMNVIRAHEALLTAGSEAEEVYRRMTEGILRMKKEGIRP